MKTATYTITKDIQTVWMLSNGNTIIGTRYDEYFVRTSDGIMTYTKDEMIEIYNLNENHFANIKHSGV